MTSRAFLPVKCSNAKLNRVILNCGSQTIIGALA